MTSINTTTADLSNRILTEAHTLIRGSGELNIDQTYNREYHTTLQAINYAHAA
ncbi:hypothetical protein [Candidatus Frankia nodulisporulans]|uniref:hypothetical protein n=1 Tax=Candidatus Frankia nodulisporulans TaxID=2060052 RepID=UPI0013CF7609|nr:hypothetical protein [Candidatus Frankia nodulisporulans]